VYLLEYICPVGFEVLTAVVRNISWYIYIYLLGFEVLATAVMKVFPFWQYSSVQFVHEQKDMTH
jgi:hypothetical protein